MVELVERMEIMFQQEIKSYKTVDYLAPDFQKKIASICDMNLIEPISPKNSSDSQSSCSTSGINDIWREKICEWSFQVCDHFDMARETVSISIHFLDRFLATRPCNKKVFQLAAMTTLFLAIKLYEPGKISMQSMIELSRGYFQVEQMVAMEMAILRALSWQVHPPTAYCFGKHVLYLLPCTAVTMDDRHAILELVRFLTELSVIDYFFVVYKASVVALAAILNSMEDIPGAKLAISIFCLEVKKNTPLDPSHTDVLECRNRLRLLYAQGGYSNSAAERADVRNESISPVCVSYGCQPSQNQYDPYQSKNPRT